MDLHDGTATMDLKVEKESGVGAASPGGSYRSTE